MLTNRDDSVSRRQSHSRLDANDVIPLAWYYDTAVSLAGESTDQFSG